MTSLRLSPGSAAVSTSVSTSTSAVPNVVELTQQLIRFVTVNPPGAEAECVRWCRDLLRDGGLETQLLANDPLRPNLVARLRGRGQAPPLLLHAHADVVPVVGQQWTRPPFGGIEADGAIWGRGAIDMKGQLAMMVTALLRMSEDGTPPAGDVILALVTDEETGSHAGARFLTEQHADLFDGVRYAIGEDGGAELGLGAYARLHPIVVAEKRTVWVRATLRGTGGHASRPPAEGSAMQKLNALLSGLADGGLSIQRTPTVDRMLSELISALPPGAAEHVAAFDRDPSDAAPLDVLGETPSRYLRALVRHTVVPTVVHGGSATNVIPAEIVVELDGRLLPGPFATDDFLKRLRERAGCEPDLEVFVEGDAVPEPRLDGLYDRLAGVLKIEDPHGTPIPIVTPASTDARLFRKIGVECFGWLPLLPVPGATHRALLHAADEHIPIASLHFGAACYHRLLTGPLC